MDVRQKYGWETKKEWLWERQEFQGVGGWVSAGCQAITKRTEEHVTAHKKRKREKQREEEGESGGLTLFPTHSLYFFFLDLFFSLSLSLSTLANWSWHLLLLYLSSVYATRHAKYWFFSQSTFYLAPCSVAYKDQTMKSSLKLKEKGARM